MSLDTQSFGMRRHWLAVALNGLPSNPKLLTPKELCTARKAFLAGKNQVAAIKNWLVCADVVEIQKGQATLTDLGKLMAAHDRKAESAWSWWLFHLHLCANVDSFPYCTFFSHIKSDGKSWWSIDDLVEELFKQQGDDAGVAEKSVGTYFQGIEQAFRPTWPIYGLGLVERRKVTSETGKERIRRRLVSPDDLVVLYAALLFQHKFLPAQPTVEARQLLEHGLGDSLGMRDIDIREAFLRIHQDSKLGSYMQYTQAANLDSVQFEKSGLPAMKQVRTHAFQAGNIRWP